MTTDMLMSTLADVFKTIGESEHGKAAEAKAAEAAANKVAEAEANHPQLSMAVKAGVKVAGIEKAPGAAGLGKTQVANPLFGPPSESDEEDPK